MLVIPNVFCRAAAIEEQQVRRDAGVGSEDAVGQTNDRVQVEIFQQVFFDPGAHSIAEQRAVGNNDGRASRTAHFARLPTKSPHDQLQEQHRDF